MVDILLYFNGKKYSLDNDMLLPEYALLDGSLLMGLPNYQKKSTILDALSQAIESYWSVNSNDTSKGYAKEAIEIIDNNLKDVAATELINCINFNCSIFGFFLNCLNSSNV